MAIPSVPGTVKISSVKAYGTNKVNIRWNKAKNATSYRIYYRSSTTKKWTAVKTVSSKTTRYTYVNSKLKAGKKYYYTVKAYNQNSKKWGEYDVTGKSVTMKKASKPSTPSHTLLEEAHGVQEGMGEQNRACLQEQKGPSRHS